MVLQHFLGKEKAGVRVRPWAPDNEDHFHASSRRFPLAEMRQGNALTQGLVLNLVCQGHGEWHHIHRSGGGRRQRSVGPQWRVAGGRTVRTVGPTSRGRTNQAFFRGQLHGDGYAFGWLPAPDSRASLSRRVCCEGHPTTGCQAIGSLELTCHVALVGEAGFGSSSGK